ncbi:MAG: PRC-barrel domain-containing protein [Bacteriovorax sp.]|jgi:sporulation protein YlmC with PRC-barrel domain
MLKNLKDMKGFKILATDTANESIGTVKDVYFDDERYAVRYLVIDTRVWLFEDLVLISPYCVNGIDWDSGIIWVNLSKDEIEHSPKAKISKPVTRKFESTFNNYFKLPHYWSNGLGMDIEGLWAGAYFPYRPEGPAQSFKPVENIEGDSKLGEELHLHSMREISGFHLRAVDDERFGSIEDFIIETETWALRYIVIDTHEFLPGGKRILLSPEWIEKFDWDNKKLVTDYLRDTIENCPEYDPTVVIDREMEEEIHAHFGRSGYWNLRSMPPSGTGISDRSPETSSY